MPLRIIQWSLQNRLLVIILTLGLVPILYSLFYRVNFKGFQY